LEATTMTSWRRTSGSVRRQLVDVADMLRGQFPDVAGMLTGAR